MPRRLNPFESERRKTQSLMTRLGELNAQVEGERTEKEEFRQEILGLRSKMENASGLSKDEVNGLVARAQAAEEQSIELSQNMATLQNQAEDYERQLNETKDDYERLMRVCREELKKRKGELGEIYDLHEGELETNRELRKRQCGPHRFHRQGQSRARDGIGRKGRVAKEARRFLSSSRGTRILA